MSDCLFCKIIAGGIPSAKVYEDDNVFAFLDINPVNPGHTLVIPKEHHPRLSDTPADVAADIMRVVPKIMKAVMKAVDASACNIGVNNGELAGQVVEHTHLHIMPRFEGDGYDIWHGKPYESDEKIESVAGSIRNNL